MARVPEPMERAPSFLSGGNLTGDLSGSDRHSLRIGELGNNLNRRVDLEYGIKPGDFEYTVQRLIHISQFEVNALFDGLLAQLQQHAKPMSVHGCHVRQIENEIARVVGQWDDVA